MNIIEKITDTLLSKNWIITTVSFVLGVVISIFIPVEFFNKLPFEQKTNVIIGFATICVSVFLIIYFCSWIIGRRYYIKTNSNKHKEYVESEIEETIEEWRCLFDDISDEEYSILMFFIITNNEKPYVEWGYRSYDAKSIFSFPLEEQFFYKTTTFKESNPYEVVDYNTKEKYYTTMKGQARVYLLKENMFEMLKNIYKSKGSLSHHKRQLYKLNYGNSEGLEEFKNTKY